MKRRSSIVLKRRAFRLRIHERFHQVRPHVGEFPGEGSALAVGNDYRWANFVEQGGVAGVVVGCLEGRVALRRDLGGVEAVEG